jgi:hypothetical protein
MEVEKGEPKKTVGIGLENYNKHVDKAYKLYKQYVENKDLDTSYGIGTSGGIMVEPKQDTYWETYHRVRA